MTLTTKSILGADFKGYPQWLPSVAPSDFYHLDIALETDNWAVSSSTEDDYVSTSFPVKRMNYIGNSTSWELLIKASEKLMPASFTYWIRCVQEGDTYGTVIDQDHIEILTRLAKGWSEYPPVIIPLSFETEAFCNNQGIRQYVALALDLLTQCFSGIRRIESEVLQDPDTGDQMMVIHLEIDGEIEAVLDMYDRYTEEWVSRVPWPERSKIALSYIVI